VTKGEFVLDFVEFGVLAAAAPEAGLVAGSVWDLGWAARGIQIERALGGNLPRSFPVIDMWNPATGAIGSIKSIDLAASTYQDGSMLYGKLTGYVTNLSEFSGANYGGVQLLNSSISSRTLILAVPNGATAVQEQAIQQVMQFGAARGVIVNVVPFP
jgi:hypothetical protein